MFKKYNSIENAYRKAFVDKCEMLGASHWVATEKVHGANFGFIVDGDTVKPLKRSSTIGKNPETGYSDFYGCNDVVAKYEKSAITLGGILGQPVIIYGELYGQGIQKEINYGPKDFICFDLYTPNNDKFLDWDAVVNLCEAAGISTVPEIGRGTLTEMLEISPEFDSIVAQRNGNSGITEGVTIKQLCNEQILKNGSRAILKNKSKGFSEKKQSVSKAPVVVPEEVKQVFEDFTKYINKNRLSNVISKIGEVSQKDFGKLQGLLVKDAKEEFERDEHKISSDDWKLIAKSVNKESACIVRESWLNILDNN